VKSKNDRSVWIQRPWAGTGTLADAIYERVRDRILLGEYALGAPLSRRRLAEEFATSLIPVAEALQRLEREGFVESQPRVGTRVKIPKAAEVRGRFVVREALETESARLFCEKATPKEKRELQRAAVKLDALSAARRRPVDDRSAYLKFERAHIAFHMQIAECSGYRELVEAIEHSRALVFNWLVGSSTGIKDVPAHFHERLAVVLSAGDVEAAGRAMREHIRYRLDEVAQYVESFSADGTAGPKILRGPQRSKSAANS
jgi:DNA-binding GntR family transcriptional regulator